MSSTPPRTPPLSAGYAHPDYAASLAQFGTPRFLERSGAWVLERGIADGPLRDAMGGYPLFCCRDWQALADELPQACGDLVSLAVVTDPFGEWDEELLQVCFPDVCTPFKEHFVVDLRQWPEDHVSGHHMRNVRKAQEAVEVVISPRPEDFLDEWVRLYGQLIRRHGITGMRAFSREAFALQLSTPGMVVFEARQGEDVVGAVLWYEDGDVAYYHLGAYSAEGYASRASYSVFWSSLLHFADQGVRWLALGAGAGTRPDATDGLTRFKRGWSTGTRTAFFCGRVLDRDAYAGLLRASGQEAGGYFPAYRNGEFT